MKSRKIFRDEDGGLFYSDLHDFESELSHTISASRFLVVGAGGTIGQAVAKQLFSRNPLALVAVDLSENSLVELVRDIRSSYGYGDGEFKTYALDADSIEFDAMVKREGPFDYVFNLSALKHVRNESDPYTLMRMIRTNVFTTLKLASQCADMGGRYFCVSTDKAANPVNMMGASKRIMEQFLLSNQSFPHIRMARFANVAFSDGSLPAGFEFRLKKQQPISAPSDVKRYFLTKTEAGELCMIAGLLGKDHDIFFPKLSEKLPLWSFSELACSYLEGLGYAPKIFSSEQAARDFDFNRDTAEWPCYFFESDTTGEKPIEEFFTGDETLDLKSFKTIGVIKQVTAGDSGAMLNFEHEILQLLEKGDWTKADLVRSFFGVLEDFDYIDKGKYLDERM